MCCSVVNCVVLVVNCVVLVVNCVVLSSASRGDRRINRRTAMTKITSVFLGFWEQLMLCSKIIALCPEIREKHTHVLCVQIIITI